MNLEDSMLALRILKRLSSMKGDSLWNHVFKSKDIEFEEGKKVVKKLEELVKKSSEEYDGGGIECPSFSDSRAVNRGIGMQSLYANTVGSYGTPIGPRTPEEMAEHNRKQKQANQFRHRNVLKNNNII